MSTTMNFVAKMVCPVCGRTSPADTSTGLVTRLLSVPAVLRVGDSHPELGWGGVPGLYPVLREPAPGEPVRLLETWTCPHCGAENWARVTLTGTTVSAIEAVLIDADTIAGAHAVSPEVNAVYWERTGEHLFPDPNGFPPDVRERLLAVLRPDSA